MSLAELFAAHDLDAAGVEELVQWARERADELIFEVQDPELVALLEPGSVPLGQAANRPAAVRAEQDPSSDGVPDEMPLIETIEPDAFEDGDDGIPVEVEDEFSVDFDDDDDDDFDPEAPVRTGDTMVNGDIDAVLAEDEAPVRTGDTLSGDDAQAVVDEAREHDDDDDEDDDEDLSLTALESGEFEMLDEDELEELELIEDEEFEDGASAGTSSGPPPPPPPPPPPSRAGVPEWATDDVSEPDLLSLAGVDAEQSVDGSEDEAVDGLVSDLLGDDAE